MKTTITIISLSAILACLTLLAQESPRPAAGGSLDGLFKRLDCNGDGKLTRDEVADAAAFAAADADKNGAVAPDEFRRYVATRQRPRPTPAPATAKPAPALPPVNGRPVLKQLPDCDAVRDAAGRGQLFECMHVGGHHRCARGHERLCPRGSESGWTAGCDRHVFSTVELSRDEARTAVKADQFLEVNIKTRRTTPVGKEAEP